MLFLPEKQISFELLYNKLIWTPETVNQNTSNLEAFRGLKMKINYRRNYLKSQTLSYVLDKIIFMSTHGKAHSHEHVFLQCKIRPWKLYKVRVRIFCEVVFICEQKHFNVLCDLVNSTIVNQQQCNKLYGQLVKACRTL